MAVVSISYKEGNKNNLHYKSVSISYNNLSKKKIFNSGNFIKDWYDKNKFIAKSDISEKEFICHSSSVNHFIMDGAPYDSAYLHLENDIPVLLYPEETPKKNDKNFKIKFLEWHERSQKIINGLEYFVDEGTKPTWEELKSICKKTNNKKIK